MSLLDALYREYHDLKEKLDKVSELIISYGGAIPDETIKSIKTDLFGKVIDEYPNHGTWKEKIIYVLKQTKRPLSNREIADFIYGLERKYQDLNPSHVSTMVIQYTSNMAATGDVSVDKSSGRYKYSLKQ